MKLSKHPKVSAGGWTKDTRPIGELLKAWRAEAGLTQEQAAEELGIPVRTVENWEQRFSEPRGFARTAIQAELSKRLNAKKRK